GETGRTGSRSGPSSRRAAYLRADRGCPRRRQRWERLAPRAGARTPARAEGIRSGRETRPTWATPVWRAAHLTHPTRAATAGTRSTPEVRAGLLATAPMAGPNRPRHIETPKNLRHAHPCSCEPHDTQER